MSEADGNAPVEYRSIEGYEGYRVGNDGTVWSAWQRRSGFGRHGVWWISSEWRECMYSAKDTGHLRVAMTAGGKAKHHFVHKIVLEAFVSKRPDSLVCRHLDGNPGNNSVENLKWGTPQENSDDAIRHGTIRRGDGHQRVKLTEAIVRESRRRARSGENTADIARELGIPYLRLFDSVYGKSWKWITDEPPVSKPTKRLTDGDVARIRQLSCDGMEGQHIAAMFGISEGYVSMLKNGKMRPASHQ